MNLYDAVLGLEGKNITVAINLGEHGNCPLESNCPIAIELRRLVVEAGVTLEELVEGYQSIANPNPVAYNPPEFSGKVAIFIAGKQIELDLDQIISGELKTQVEHKITELDEMKGRVGTLGRGLYSSYLHEITSNRTTHTLPQLGYTRGEMVSTKCLITGDGDRYTFLLPVEYKPESLIESGIRFKMAREDVTRIKRKAYLQFIVTRAGRFISATLQDDSGNKLRHYHGDGNTDCWGSVRLPTRWDKTLRSLSRLKTALMGSLATINMNSILQPHPPDMPDHDDVMSRSERLGREGELTPTPRGRRRTTPTPWRAGTDTDGDTQEEEDEDEDEGEPTGWHENGTRAGARGGWGTEARGRRQRPEGQPPEVLEAERVRRFGMASEEEYRQDLERICNLCGGRAGDHHEGGVICPRDHHR